MGTLAAADQLFFLPAYFLNTLYAVLIGVPVVEVDGVVAVFQAHFAVLRTGREGDEFGAAVFGFAVEIHIHAVGGPADVGQVISPDSYSLLLACTIHVARCSVWVSAARMTFQRLKTPSRPGDAVPETSAALKRRRSRMAESGLGMFTRKSDELSDRVLR